MASFAMHVAVHDGRKPQSASCTYGYRSHKPVNFVERLRLVQHQALLVCDVQFCDTLSTRVGVTSGSVLSCQPDMVQQPSQVLLAADYVQKKSRSKKSKAVQSTEDTGAPGDDQENIANNASPPAEAAADPDKIVQVLSR